jgi:hypothetical protein
MRKVLFLTTLLAFIFTSSLWAADISGNWTLKMTGRQGEELMPLVIKATGEKLTVTVTHPRFQEMAGTGTLKGNAIEMTVTGTGEMKMGIKFTGTVTGNTMSGTREMIRPAGAQGGGQGGQQGGMPGGQSGQMPSGGQGQGGPSSGEQASGGQGGMPGGGQGSQGGQGGPSGQGGQGSGQAQISNTWTAEKK